MGRTLINIIGKKFGQLLVLHRVKDRFNGRKRRHSEAWFRCLCDCGKIVSKRGYLLRDGRCRQCGHARGIRHGMCYTREYRVWNTAKSRATELGYRFDLKPSDIFIPKECPLLGIRLCLSNHKTKFNSPSIDRINSRRGYVRGNIWVISQKANTIKSNASLAELKTLVQNLEKKHGLLVR